MKTLSKYPQVKIREIKDITIVEMFDIPYGGFLEIQEELTEIVRQDSKKKFYLFASHPLTLTMGRGDRQNQDLGNESQVPNGIEFFQIKRGGGLTFHTPNQWIFYPIVKLNNSTHTLTKHIEWLMDIVTETCKREFDLPLIPKRNPLGVWYGVQKLGSVGVGVERFITNHGLAFNVDKINITEEQFKVLNPCGLSSSTYTSLSQAIQKQVLVESFHRACLKTLQLTN